MSNAIGGTTRAAAEILQSLAGRKRQKRSTADNVIDLTADPDDSPSIKESDNDSDDDDDEVLIVDAPTKAAPVNTDAAADASQANNDVQVMGTVNALRLPHMRCHCTEYLFSDNDAPSNSEYCDLCYCYVCDVPVKDCIADWEGSHCFATDKGPRAEYWGRLRQQVQSSKVPETLLEARLAHGKLFKSIFQTMGTILDDQVCLECIPGHGIKCTAQNERGQPCLFSWELEQGAFETFQCNEKVLLHVNISHVNDAMKGVRRKTQGLVLKASSSFLFIILQDSTNGESETTKVSLCRNGHYTPVATPNHAHVCNAQIRSADFKRIIGHLRNLGGDTCIIRPLSNGPNSLSFCSPYRREALEGSVAKCSFTLQPGSGSPEPGPVVVATNGRGGPVEVPVSSLILYILTRTPPMSPHVHLGLSPNGPMLVEYDLLRTNSHAKLGRFSVSVDRRLDENY